MYKVNVYNNINLDKIFKAEKEAIEYRKYLLTINLYSTHVEI